MSRSRTSAATSASVRPTRCPDGDARDDPVRGVRRERQQRDLVRVLDHPQLPQHGAGEAEVRPGWQAPLEREQVERRQRVRHGQARRATLGQPEPLDDDRVRVVGLVPRHGRDRRRQAGRGRGGLQAGHDEERRPARDDDQHREPLERHRGIARQVAEIRPDPDEQGVEARGAGHLGSAGEPVRVAPGRDRRAIGDRPHHGAPWAGVDAVDAGRASARASQRSTVAGPSSASLR